MKALYWMLAALAWLSLPGLAGCGSAAGQGRQDRVVYHLSDGLAQASNGLRNINNHLEVNPNAKIIVVSHALGGGESLNAR